MGLRASSGRVNAPFFSSFSPPPPLRSPRSFCSPRTTANRCWPFKSSAVIIPRRARGTNARICWLTERVPGVCTFEDFYIRRDSHRYVDKCTVSHRLSWRARITRKRDPYSFFFVISLSQRERGRTLYCAANANEIFAIEKLVSARSWY